MLYIGVWVACFFHVNILILFDIDVDMHVNIIRVSKLTETLAKKCKNTCFFGYTHLDYKLTLIPIQLAVIWTKVNCDDVKKDGKSNPKCFLFYHCSSIDILKIILTYRDVLCVNINADKHLCQPQPWLYIITHNQIFWPSYKFCFHIFHKNVIKFKLFCDSAWIYYCKTKFQDTCSFVKLWNSE